MGRPRSKASAIEPVIRRTARKGAQLLRRQESPNRAEEFSTRRGDNSQASAQNAQPAAVASDLEALAERIRVCTECPLHLSRTIAVPGEGRADAKVMIIGEGPGAKEDKTGRPFVGSAGKYLEHVLKGTRFTRDDFFITNVVKCRPPGNRTPKATEIDTCTSLYLSRQIQLVNPKIILLLGSAAVKRLLGLPSVEEARGKVVEKDGRRFLASYHPAVRFYREDLAAKVKEDFQLLTTELEKVATSPGTTRAAK